IGRNDADVSAKVDEGLLVEVLRIDHGRVDVGEDLEFVRTADVVAVARRAVGHDLLAVGFAHLTGLERLDHAVLGCHTADPLVAFDAHLSPCPLRTSGYVFCTTMLGNFDVMSFACSAILTATRRAIWR